MYKKHGVVKYLFLFRLLFFAKFDLRLIAKSGIAKQIPTRIGSGYENSFFAKKKSYRNLEGFTHYMKWKDKDQYRYKYLLSKLSSVLF